MENETALAIGAHYDDSGYCWVALVKMLEQYGQVEEAVFTDSNYSGNGLIREQEQREMMKILGMGKLHTVGKDKNFEDYHLKDVPWGLIFNAIKRIVDQTEIEGRPITRIISFGPDGYTGHRDHKELAEVVGIYFNSEQNHTVKELWQVGMPKEEREKWPSDYFFNIPKIDVFNGYEEIKMSNEVFDLKKQAIEAHKTQYKIPGGGGCEQIARMSHSEWFKVYRRK